MKRYLSLTYRIVIYSLLLLALAACGPSPIPIATPEMPTPTRSLPTAAPTLTAIPTQVPTASASTEQSAVVAFVKDGNIQVWDEATGQSETIFDAGDVIAVTMSEDGQVVAFLRRSVVRKTEQEWLEQSALWAVDRNGENPRELVPAEELRELLNASETDSTNFPQMEWIPGTHRLLYSGWIYFVQAEGESHATPGGLYLVDADTLGNSVLLPASNNMRFAPSPNGQQIALMSTAGLGFINADGSNHRPDVFPYAQVGLGGQAFPSGVWTQDGRAFLLATYLEKSPDTDPGLAIWRVPLEGAPAQLTDAVTGSHPDSVTFSPDGRFAAFFRGGGGPSGWFVTPLAGEVSPLAIPKSSYLFLKNLHWSPEGAAYAIADKTLFQLCPGATQDTEVCGEGLELRADLAEIYWIDGTRYLFVTREPYDLYFGTLDGTRIRIAEGAERFAAAGMACRNDFEFTAGGEGPAYASVAPDTLFRTTWRIRNAGTCAWDASYRLAFLDGERLSGPRSLPLGETVPPGGEIELSVKLIAPNDPGTYQGEWQLFDPNGAPFGVRPAVDIVVPSYTVMELTPDQIVAKISAGPGPIAGPMVLGEGAVWVANGNNSVSRIGLDTNQVVANLPVGELPAALATGYGAVWAAGNETVIRIDPQTNQVSATIPVVPPLSGLNGIAAGAGSMWVTSFSEGRVYRIDPNTNQVSATIPVEPGPHQIAVTDDAVWVTNPIDPVLTRIDPTTNEVSAAISLECGIRKLAVDPTAVWVPCENHPALFHIDPLTNQIAARVAIGNRSAGVALGSNAVWVTSGFENTLTRIDPATNQVIAVYKLGGGPFDVVAAQDELWVVMSGEGSVWRIRPQAP